MMEQDRKEKARVPAEVRALAALEKEKDAVKDAAGSKAVVADRGKVKGAVKHRGGAADKINRLPLEKGA